MSVTLCWPNEKADIRDYQATTRAASPSPLDLPAEFFSMVTTISPVGFLEREMSVKLFISFLCSFRHLESLALVFHEAADIEDIDSALELSSHLATISLTFELPSIRIFSSANVAEAQQIKLEVEIIEGAHRSREVAAYTVEVLKVSIWAGWDCGIDYP
ncbi:hypothetical protein C8J56DRAFT_1110010 [Mycena floridula]|nr:hypothetical protein C8J56DRAFT_1110010 [Mycena floridula]